MSEKSHLAKFAEFVIGDDSSELGIARAERDYALHCLEREIAIARAAEAKCGALVKAMEKIAAMDPIGVRDDDLGRAARIARYAIPAVVGTGSKT